MKTALRLLLAPYRFSVDRLFRMGEVGWAHWYDSPSLYPGGNHLYLYQDSAGTTPVTAVGQSIGLTLDRAYGGARGANMAAASYATTAGYDNGTTVVSATAFTQTAGTTVGRTYLDLSTVVGKTYELTATVTTDDTGNVLSYARNATGGGGTILSTSNAITAATPGTQRLIFTATTTTSSILWTTPNTGKVLAATGISIREIPGTHLTQATVTARPTLSARVNALLNTETLGGTGWTANGGGTSLSGQTAPDGTSTAVRITSSAVLNSGYYQGSLTAHGGQQREGIWLRGVSGGEAVSFGDATNRTDVVLTTSWAYYTGTVTKASAFFVVYATGTVAQSWFAWHPDSRTADDAAKNIPAYQRVGATAADHDTGGFPHAAYPDGTDDNGTTATGGGNTTGFFYCGVLTVSGGAGTARTIWSDTGTNTGYRVRINSSNKLELAAGNGSAYTTVQSNETITAPGTYLLSAWDDGGVLAVQVNNFAPATTTRPSVSAGTAAITVYKDNGAASSYFNGRDYGSVYAQRYIGETAHNRLKRYLANVARITV